MRMKNIEGRLGRLENQLLPSPWEGMNIVLKFQEPVETPEGTQLVSGFWFDESTDSNAWNIPAARR